MCVCTHNALLGRVRPSFQQQHTEAVLLRQPRRQRRARRASAHYDEVVPGPICKTIQIFIVLFSTTRCCVSITLTGGRPVASHQK